ncbi:hypothetical protein ACEWY4_023125 [Coilia grayii]|uniref:protein-serine/threonine phosphatase n=1 Tax=Coilia grayii TaxID=363190 RepID=A0ABD1J253_9TELE
MSTCALLLVSQAGCGLSESPQPPPQADLSEHCVPSGHRLLTGESNTLGECIERFQAANFCSHFGARGGDLSHFLESSFRGEIVVQSAPMVQNMPAEDCADQSKFLGQEEHKSGQEECFDRASGLNSADRKNSSDFSEDCEFQGINRAMERRETAEMQIGHCDGTPELSEQVAENLSVHSESSQKSQTEEMFFEKSSCTNLVSTSEVSDQDSKQHVQSEETLSMAELQSSSVESSHKNRSVELVSETLEPSANLNSVSEVLVHPDKCEPLHTEVTDPSLEHTQSFKQCEAGTQDSGTVQEGGCVEVSENEKPSKRDCETATDVCQSCEQSMPAVNSELGENPTPTNLRTTTCKVYDTSVEKPSDMCDAGEQPMPSEALSRRCSSLENSQHADVCNEISSEQMRPDTSAEDCRPTEGSAGSSKTLEQCESSKHFESAKQCSSLDSCAKYSCASKINKPCQHHNAHSERLKEQQKMRRSKSESDILLTGSMDNFETLWLSQFVVKPKSDTLSLDEYACCENCDLCGRFSKHMEVSERRPTPVSCGGVTQQEDKLQTCDHLSESSNSEVSVHCIACEETETTKHSEVSHHNESSQHRELSEGLVQSQEDNLHEVCTDVQVSTDVQLDLFLNQDGLLKLGAEEGRDITKSVKPDVESFDGSSVGDDFHPCSEKSQDGSETELSFKTCSDGSECDENCSELSYSIDKLQAEEAEENDQYAAEPFVSKHDSQESLGTEDGVEAEDKSCECLLECEDQTCDYLWTEEDGQSADLLDVEFYEEEDQESSVEELEEDGSEPESEGDSLEPHIDGECPESPGGTGEVYGDSSVEKMQPGGQLKEPLIEDKVSQLSVAHALYQSQTVRYFLERRKLSEAEAYGHYAADVCRLDLIFDPWAELETSKEEEAVEVATEKEKQHENKDSATTPEDGEGNTPSPGCCERRLIIPDIILSESPDENNEEDIGESLEKNEGLLSCPEIPYGIEASETPEPLCLDFFKPDQGEGLSDCVEKAKCPEHKHAESAAAPKVLLLSDLITQQTKPSENRVDHAKTSEHSVESPDHSEHCTTHEFFKLADERKTPEPSETEDYESEDEDFSEDCQCEFCVPTEEVPAKPLLPQIKSKDAGKICVVIDLDETLVHSSFKPVNNADFIIPVEIDGTVHQVYVLKRPHVDEFLKRMGELFECVLFTASLAKYADPVSDLLDKWGAFRSRLFRESCVFHRGNYVKDLSRLGRDLNKVIIVDNSPASYIFHPDNAVPVASWFDDMSDTELLDLIPFFERLSKVDDVYAVLKQHRTTS